MKIPKINMQDILKSATDTSVISFRANGRTWTFKPNGTIICYEGLNPLNISDSSFLSLLEFDFDTLCSIYPLPLEE